ncbi:MAG TPA: ATP-binding protein [Candidatus Limnocylindria bacterium]
MSLRRNWRDVVALSIALAALLASVALWADGRVVIGLELREGSSEEDGHPGVFVAEVVPDGNAAREMIGVGQRVLELTTVDGGEVEQGPPEFISADGDLTGIPVEAVSPERIDRVIVGDVYEDTHGETVVYGYGWLERAWLESQLETDIYAVGLGILLGLVVGYLLYRGQLRAVGRDLAVVAGSAAALPLLLVPVVKVGNPIGIYAIYAAVLIVSLLLGLLLAERLQDPGRRRGAMAAAIGSAALAAALVVLHMQTPELSPDERGPIAILLGSVAFSPAIVATVSERRTVRERAGLLTLGAIPAAASIAIMPSDVQPVLPVVIVGLLLFGHALPWEQFTDRLVASFAGVRSGAVSTGGLNRPSTREGRDFVALTLVGVSLVASLGGDTAWAIVLAGAIGLMIYLAVRQGTLGGDWTDAAVPLAASVAVPILLVPLTWYTGEGNPGVVGLTVASSLVVAHVLAERHSDADVAARLFASALVFGILLVVAGLLGTPLLTPLVGLIPLIPGIPVAFARRTEAAAVSWRLEALAVALTPLAAITVLLPGGAGVFVLTGWLLAVVVWRYLALNPLMGIALRTQLQRDLAVAAAETERARLAADLHDDALQQLTMLVRTLDEGGQKEAAEEAREIATKLRSVVGDLRLPILDDLGAGAALEWLVERVGPLAGGPVKLERSDETRPPANVELAVFRVAQEALANAIKHGKAPIAVRYDVRADGRVTLAIDDAGEGIGSGAAEEAPTLGHFGLLNMQQRAEQIGALLDVRRWPAGGTRVALEWRPQ